MTPQQRLERVMNPEFISRYQEVMDYLSKPYHSYTLLYEPHSVPKIKNRRKWKVGMQKDNTKETKTRRQWKVGVQKDNTKASTSWAPKSKSKMESTYKNKPEKKATTKAVPQKFPNNVKTLTGTGMFDGVAVQYVSKTKKKELRGIIKGASYVCGCDSCNYSKTINAYEFEDHAGCKTSHPNNHIHFENGKSMHKVVLELKSTPESMLFDAIQTVTGSPINQKSFFAWKESYQAASSKV